MSKYKCGQANKIGIMPDIGKKTESHKLNRFGKKVEWWIELITAMKGIGDATIFNRLKSLFSSCIFVYVCARVNDHSHTKWFQLEPKTTDGQFGVFGIQLSIENLYW